MVFGKSKSKAKNLEDEPKREETTEDLEKRALQTRNEQMEKELKAIDYIKFPTILGWFFDGFFTQNYTLNEEYTEYFAEVEEEQEAIKDTELTETFAEKASRNFWPPGFTGPIFRTRGIYLDFKECIEDPPRTPPEIQFDKSNNDGGDGGDNDTAGGDDRKGGENPRKDSLRDNWYWDDDEDIFLPKEPEVEYIFDPAEKVYKKAVSGAKTPYDWYFHEEKGKFFRIDKEHPNDYEFDHIDSVWKKKGVQGPSVNFMAPSDYYYDENEKRWKPLGENNDKAVKPHIQGRRQTKKGPRGASGLTPDDYYYDGDTGKMLKKNPATEDSYRYDPKDGMWKRMGDDYGPGSSGLYPQDYSFNKEEGTWLPKRDEERKKISPYDFYFDDNKGRYFPRDKSTPELYQFNHPLNVWTLKSAKGPSVNDLNNRDYYFNEIDQNWQLCVKTTPSSLDIHEAGRRNVKIGPRGKSGKTDDDYYYDSTEGKFILKNRRKLADYVYDTDNEIFRKKNQPLVPGAGKLPHSDYYFDTKEGEWLPTPGADSGPKIKPRDRPELGPYDWCFNNKTGTFDLKNPTTPEMYKYQEDTAVYHNQATRGPSTNGKAPKDYYFDEKKGQWILLNSEPGIHADFYNNGARCNELGPRGKTGLIPDDLYFDTREGVFKKKDKDTPEIYYYDPKTGVWKLKDGPPGPGKNGLTETNYYWDDELGDFFLKDKLKQGELYVDKNTNLWKIKRRRPKDFYWDRRVEKWVRKPGKGMPPGNMGKRIGGDGRDGASNRLDKDQKGVLRKSQQMADDLEDDDDEEGNLDYDKPWLHNFPHLAADKYRLEYELQRRKDEEQHKIEEKERKIREEKEKEQELRQKKLAEKKNRKSMKSVRKVAEKAERKAAEKAERSSKKSIADTEIMPSSYNKRDSDKKKAVAPPPSETASESDITITKSNRGRKANQTKKKLK